MCVGASRRRMASLHTAHARRSLVDLNRARMCRHLPIASAGTQPAAHHPRALHRLAPRHSSTCLRDKCHGKVSAVCVRACVRVARCGFAWTKALRYETAESSRGPLQIIHTPGARARSLSLSRSLALTITHSLTHSQQAATPSTPRLHTHCATAPPSQHVALPPCDPQSSPPLPPPRLLYPSSSQATASSPSTSAGSAGRSLARPPRPKPPPTPRFVSRLLNLSPRGHPIPSPHRSSVFVSSACSRRRRLRARLSVLSRRPLRRKVP